MLTRIMLLSFAAAALCGCARQFMAVAPAPADGYVYVVGSRGGFAQAWVCPATPGKDCVEVTVHEQER